MKARRPVEPRAGFAGSERYRAIRRVLLVVLLLDLAMAAGKGTYGYLKGSLGMLADGLHSVMHAAAGVVGLVGVHLASRPPDPEHPYGYERYEPLAAMGIAVVMILALREVLERAWARLWSPEAPAVTGLSFAIMLAATGVTLALAGWERRRSRELSSSVLHADAARAWSDTLVSSSVIVGLFAVSLGFAFVDTLVSVAVAGIIAWTAWGIVRGASRVLTDAAVGDAKQITAAASSVAGVRSCHQVRARGVAGMVRVDLHVTVDPAMRVDEAHRVAEEVERRVRAQVGGVAEVLVHVGAATLH